jgi:acyl-[acyl carrier protein]--UDP-N-acetylglucosamine O-acyltransferase
VGGGEQLIETLLIALDAALDKFAVFGQNTTLAGVVVEVDAYVVHGWS